MAAMEAKLEAESAAYQAIQKDLTKAVESRQRLDSQLQENELVQKEFSLLAEGANIYKLIGPVLVKQDRSEATSNVDKRLEFIRAEIKRVERQLSDLTEKSEKKKMELVKLQTAYQEQTEKGKAK
ncbi:prefoldin subunit 6 [Jimgerdemannia flammicorona]|uniref:Prefoldin subunit 6 n=1 Tax=Jimgerdemannia flammicorona TaxID=994334 RepID=A0A433QF81_9FUNG|nr:prefoldin subunit 6 [Jimgerdemannia flammicorona]